MSERSNTMARSALDAANHTHTFKVRGQRAERAAFEAFSVEAMVTGPMASGGIRLFRVVSKTS